MNDTICICGGGALGHVVSGFLAHSRRVKVNILTRRPEDWQTEIDVILPNGKIITGDINKISDNPEVVIPGAKMILLALPGFAISQQLEKIRPYISRDACIGSVVSSTGYFFEALKVLGKGVNTFGFQRVPFIARVKQYGYSANLLGYKDRLDVAIEGNCDKEAFRLWIETLFETPTHLLNSYLEASITNSNPLLHTARLRTMFKDWKPGITYPRQYLFYEEWTDAASILLEKMDHELFAIINKLPLDPNYLTPILRHYDSETPQQLTKKLRSIDSFKGIKSPMVYNGKGWIPDFDNRYFIEDFDYGLRYIYELANQTSVSCPNIADTYHWMAHINEIIGK